MAAWWHPQPSCHLLSELFPSVVLDLALYTCGKQTSGNSSNALKQPFFSLENSFHSVPLLLFSLERGAQMECFRPGSCYFPSSEVLRLVQSDVSADGRGRELLGPDVV